MNKLGGRFALVRELGSGGMAQVYLGRDQVLDRPIAVKVLSARHAATDIAARFEREGRMAARLSHPNVVQVYDAGDGDLDGKRVSYIVMEYLSGGDLKGLVDREGPLPTARLAGLGAEVASGLAHAHERGVIHRDVKPHNVLLDASGRPKLTDFGISRALDMTQATRTGSYLGTALYSPPEQLRGKGVVPKSDVYSLGVTLYQAATGDVPFAGTPIEVASQHISAAPPPPSSFRSGIDAGLEALILDCLEKDSHARPTAEEVRERLLDVAKKESRPLPPPADPPPSSTRVAPAPPPPRSRPSSPVGVASSGAGRARSGRRGSFLLAAALLLVLLLGGGALALLGGNETETGQAPAGDQGSQQDDAPSGGGQENDANPGGGNGQGSQDGNSGGNAASDQGAQQDDSSVSNQAGDQEDNSGSGNEASGTGDDGQQGETEDSPPQEEEQPVQEAQEPAPEPAPEEEQQEPAASEDDVEEEGGGDAVPTSGSSGSGGDSGTGSDAGATEEAAVQTVVDHYAVAASDNYPDAWSFLSSRYQGEVGSQSAWTDQFSTLESIEYTSGPTAEVSGDTATVTFSTRATHTNRVDELNATMTLVQEGGEWRIDGLIAG